INNELKLYNENLLARPMLVLANKMDLEDAPKNLQRFKAMYPDVEVFEAITLVNEGTEGLLYRLADILDQMPKDSLQSEEDMVVFKYEKPQAPFTITRLDADLWQIEGEQISRLLGQFNFEFEDEMIRFGMTLKRMGIDEALREKGAQHGDTIILDNIQFVFDEGMVE
ncbi:MAG TPA: Obg family GTPase CgtA, partial [Erysipelothrix sp.]|nr:Obg family GTPase CgtA [Erysipelothrix sp.]